MRSVGREFPLFLAEAAGATVTDADGNRYIDLVGSWGPMIVGHAHPAVVAAVREAMGRGSSFGAPTQGESDLATRVKRVYPQIERMRFVSSGTEASMSAIRLARSHTGREKVLKFAGCYHGHVDALLAEAGSGLATLGIPSSPGVPAAVTPAPSSCPTTTTTRSTGHSPPTAPTWPCAIVEGVPGNMGVVPPVRGFLERLQARCRAAGALLRGRRRHERLPRRRRRGGRAVRARSRPDRPRQDRRRRPAGGGVRRPADDHGAARPDRLDLPGGHAVRQPAGDGRRLRDARPAAGAGRLRARSTRPPHGSRPGSSRPPATATACSGSARW